MADPKTTNSIARIVTSEAVGAAMGEFGRLSERELQIARFTALSACRWTKRLIVTHLDNLEINDVQS